jgi:hypothetical protein
MQENSITSMMSCVMAHAPHATHAPLSRRGFRPLLVPGLNKRPRYSARGQVGDQMRRQSAPCAAPESIALRGAGLSACPALISNKEVRGGNYDPRYKHEHARKQHNVDGEAGHCTLPILRTSRAAGITPLLKVGGKVTAGCLNLGSGTPVGRGLHGLQGCPLSNAQCQQLDNAQSDKEDRESYGIIIEPISIRMHDATHSYAKFCW